MEKVYLIPLLDFTSRWRGSTESFKSKDKNQGHRFSRDFTFVLDYSFPSTDSVDPNGFMMWWPSFCFFLFWFLNYFVVHQKEIKQETCYPKYKFSLGLHLGKRINSFKSLVVGLENNLITQEVHFSVQQNRTWSLLRLWNPGRKARLLRHKTHRTS